MDFLNLDYLKTGSARQKQAYEALSNSRLFIQLSEYNPILAGTIPLEIDIETSDLDILCDVKDFDQFERKVAQSYSSYSRFSIQKLKIRNRESIVVNFSILGFDIEIFGQNQPTSHQDGYIHLAIESRLLNLGGNDAREAIRTLKQKGVKTEPAVASYFGIQGKDPYLALIQLAELSDEELILKFGNRS